MGGINKRTPVLLLAVVVGAGATHYGKIQKCGFLCFPPRERCEMIVAILMAAILLVLVTLVYAHQKGPLNVAFFMAALGAWFSLGLHLIGLFSLGQVGMIVSTWTVICLLWAWMQC